jgi:hypothetical protein
MLDILVSDVKRMLMIVLDYKVATGIQNIHVLRDPNFLKDLIGKKNELGSHVK